MRLSLSVMVLAGLLPVAARACEYLTSRFELCSEGTPWADGVWVQGGDSATLYLGEIGFESFTDYSGHDPKKTIEDEMADVEADDPGIVIKTHQKDQITGPELKILRLIQSVRLSENKPSLRVTMIADFAIADFAGARIMMLVSAPDGTPLETLEALSREYASLVRPVAAGGGN